MENLSNLYVHFPYCEAKCHYCDFYSLPESKHEESVRLNAYSAILSELSHYDAVLGKLDTLFMGGGTPSLVPLPEMEKIFSKLSFHPSCEITMEANPSSISKEKAKAWRHLGINRISLGVQALNNERLIWLGRVHNKKEIFEALDILQSAGFDNISTDYIVGVPQQTPQLIESELKELYENFSNLKHTSAYLLTLKSSNPKFKELLDEDMQLTHLQTVRDVLKSFGFEQYEISNFAKSGFKARHNENYWLGGSYLGIGPSAHSYIKNEKKRFKNVASISTYIESLQANRTPIEWEEKLNLEQERIEYIMLRLRHADGIDTQEYRKLFGMNFPSEKSTLVTELTRLKLIEHTPGTVKLTSDGFFISDPIIQKLIA